MNVVRDLLDMPIVDADGRPIGRVDGVIAEYVAGRPLRLEAIELSGATLARRLSPRLVGFARALAGRLSPRRGRPCRFPLRSVRLARRRVELAKGTETGMALAWERWLRHAVVDRIPGG
jgi:hypothetical protein